MSNLDRFRQSMIAANVPAALISNMSNVGWLTGFTGSAGAVIVTKTDALFVTDSRYTIQATEEVKDMQSISFASPVEMVDFIYDQLKKLGVSAVGFESGDVVYDTFKKWSDKFIGIELTPLPTIVAPLRMVKTPDELNRLKRACALADAAFEHIKNFIRVGAREIDIHLELEFYIRRQGAELSFTPIVVSGERSARPHGVASEKQLQAGDFVTMDFGAKLDGMCSDLTRTVVVKEASERHKEVYGAVLEAQLSALAVMKPGIKAADVDAAARNKLKEHDLAQYFGHGLGHGLGSVVHDSGRMGPTSTDVLEVGQIWTVEPGAYIPGFGGVRIEDDVVITESGYEYLTHSPKELLVLP